MSSSGAGVSPEDLVLRGPGGWGGGVLIPEGEKESWTSKAATDVRFLGLQS